MADPFLYEYPSPLEGYKDLDPLPNEKDQAGRGGKAAIFNPPTGVLSKAYDGFIHPIVNDNKNGFDVHIYFYQENEEQATFAKELWERIRREFPELRIYSVHEKPIGPHVTGMFEVNIFTPAQFGAFISWLVINRGPLSALVHPNTGDPLRDHTQRATWMGRELPLDLGKFKKMVKP
ncbi:hypothetical protein MMC14_008679 [Varicellaria rhodocarpa]|nr:hypothetical protein [Varicellaria rhodocarpa]